MTRKPSDDDEIARIADRDDQPDERVRLPRMLTLNDAVEDLGRITRLPRYPTPFPTLNDALGLGGVIGGQVFILAGGTGMGKTTFILGLANHHATHHGPVLFVSLEMRAGHCVARAAAAHLGVSANSLITGEVAVHPDHTGISHRIVWVETCTLPELRSAVEHLKKMHGVAPLVVVDYLGLLAAQVLASMTERADARLATTATSATLRAIARELEAPLLVTSAAGRGSAAKIRGSKRGGRGQDPRDMPPGELVDVAKESGDVEYDAAGILVLNVSDELDCDGLALATLTVAKARFGRAQHIAMAYDGARALWVDRGRVEPKKKESTAKDVSAERAAQLNEISAAIVALLKAGPLSKARIREHIGKRRDDVWEALTALIVAGTVMEKGTGPARKLMLADSARELPGIERQDTGQSDSGES